MTEMADSVFVHSGVNAFVAASVRVSTTRIVSKAMTKNAQLKIEASPSLVGRGSLRPLSIPRGKAMARRGALVARVFVLRVRRIERLTGEI